MVQCLIPRLDSMLCGFLLPGLVLLISSSEELAVVSFEAGEGDDSSLHSPVRDKLVKVITRAVAN